MGSSEPQPLCTSGLSWYTPPLIAQTPTAITNFGAGTAAYVSSNADRIFSVTGPVITTPSACRGEATNWMPNRPRSKTTVLSTFRSDSQALQPPADTCRNLSDRPN